MTHVADTGRGHRCLFFLLYHVTFRPPRVTRVVLLDPRGTGNGCSNEVIRSESRLAHLSIKRTPNFFSIPLGYGPTQEQAIPVPYPDHELTALT